jgi:hypothetical protein
MLVQRGYLGQHLLSGEPRSRPVTQAAKAAVNLIEHQKGAETYHRQRRLICPVADGLPQGLPVELVLKLLRLAFEQSEILFDLLA